MNEATARIRINRLLEEAGWRFLPEGDKPANVRLEAHVSIKARARDGRGYQTDINGALREHVQRTARSAK